jgi:hypothetical protein
MDETYEVTVPPREHPFGPVCANVDEAVKRWHNLKIWNRDQLEHRSISFTGVGDFVEVSGYPEIIDIKGNPPFDQVIVQRYRCLRLSSKHRAPEIPPRDSGGWR